MLYPVKLLSDMQREPFFPFMISDAVFINGTNRTVQQELDNRYTIPEIDNMFTALGTVMDFRGVVENEKQLPPATPDTKGDVYVVLHYYESIICHTVINDGTKWIDMGEPLDLDNYYTKKEVELVIDEKVDTRAKEERTITNNAISKALLEANTYTDTSIEELHMEQYAPRDEMHQYVYDNVPIKAYYGTYEEPIYLDDIDFGDDGSIFALFQGYFWINKDLPLPDSFGMPGMQAMMPFVAWESLVMIRKINYGYNHYDVTVYDFMNDIFRLNHFELEPNYIKENQTSAITDYMFNNWSFSINQPWTFNSSLQCTKVPQEDYDVVNLKYLNEQVVNPLRKLVARLNGEDVSQWD